MRSRSQSFSFSISMSFFNQVLAVILVVFLFLPVFASAQDNQQEKKPGGPGPAQAAGETQSAKMQEVVVTASRYSEEVSNIPANVTVITAKDIKNSTAVNVPDLLRTQAGINVADVTGSKRKYNVDMRGFGDSSQLNTLVLVDGRRVTQADLSGTDWVLIPLDRIERIEIVRGGRGGVLYGDNATAGVVNIITKQGEATRFGADVNGGSYKTFNGSAYGEGKLKDLSYALSGRYYNTDGYRLNSDVESKDVGANLKYNLGSSNVLSFSTSYHKDDTGLPGALKESDFAKGLSRKDSTHPNDFANTEDYYFKLGSETYFWGESFFKIDASYRRRSASLFSSFGGGFDSTADSDLDNFIISPQVLINKKIAGLDNKLTFGFDYLYSKLDITNELTGFTPTETELKKTNYGMYALDELSILSNLILSGGYRYDRAAFDSPFSQDNKFDEYASTLGLTYKYKDNSSVFVNYGHSFRYPVLDELFSYFTNTVNNLQPQTSDTYEIGVKHQFMARLYGTVTLFRIETQDEIFLDPILFQNVNLDGKTRRDGVEVSAILKAFEWATFSAQYTHLNPEIRSGQFSGKKIPGVPENSASITGVFTPAKGWTLTVSGIYVGERPFINDYNNAVDDLNGYFVVNGKLKYKWNAFSAYVDVNNAAGRKYSEFGALATFPVTERGYYPSPTANFLVGLAADF